MKCPICSYKAISSEERRNIDLYGCARTEIKKVGFGLHGRLCRYDPETRKYIPPSEEVENEEFSEEAKELFCKKYEKKSKKDEK